MALGRNGGMIGVDNTPTLSSASGVWTLDEVTDHVRAGRWSGLELVTTQTAATSTETDSSNPSFAGVSIGAASEDRYVVVGLYARMNSETPSVTSCTIAGQSGTELGNFNYGASGGLSHMISFCGARVVSGTMGTISFNLSHNSSRTGVIVWTVRGSMNTSEHVIEQTAVATDPLEASIAVVAGGSIIAIAAESNDNRTISWAGSDTLLEDAEVDVGGAGMIFSGASSDFAAGATEYVNADWSVAPTTSGLLVISLRP